MKKRRITTIGVAVLGLCVIAAISISIIRAEVHRNSMLNRLRNVVYKSTGPMYWITPPGVKDYPADFDVCMNGMAEFDSSKLPADYDDRIVRDSLDANTRPLAEYIQEILQNFGYKRYSLLREDVKVEAIFTQCWRDMDSMFYPPPEYRLDKFEGDYYRMVPVIKIGYCDVKYNGDFYDEKGFKKNADFVIRYQTGAFKCIGKFFKDGYSH